MVRYDSIDPLCLFYNLFHFPPLLCLRYLTHHQHTFENCLVPTKPYYFPYNLFISVITPRPLVPNYFNISTQLVKLYEYKGSYTFDIRFNFFWSQLKTLFIYFMFWWRDTTKNKRNIIGSLVNIFIIHDKTNFIECVCLCCFANSIALHVCYFCLDKISLHPRINNGKTLKWKTDEGLVISRPGYIMIRDSEFCVKPLLQHPQWWYPSWNP